MSAFLLTVAMLATTPATPKATQVSAAREGNCQNPSWSRDGKALSFERVFYEEKRIELNIVRTIGGPEEVVKPVITKSAGAAKGSAWASQFLDKAGDDGDVKPGQICHELGWGPVDSPDSYAYSCNAGTYQLFWSGGGQVTRGKGASGQPAWSPKGWRLLYVSATGTEGDLFLLDRMLESTAPKPKRLLPPSGRMHRLPTWSPDGRSVAFIGHDDGGGDLYVIEDVDKAAETLVRLTDRAGEETNPSWSPDGKRIAYFVARTKGKKAKKQTQLQWDIYVVELDGDRKPYRIAKNAKAPESAGPAWTPDGKYIVFVRPDPAKAHPLRIVKVAPKQFSKHLKTNTLSNSDPVVTARAGKWWVAFTALGVKGSSDLTWRKVYTYPLDAWSKRD